MLLSEIIIDRLLKNRIAISKLEEIATKLLNAEFT